MKVIQWEIKETEKLFVFRFKKNFYQNLKILLFFAYKFYNIKKEEKRSSLLYSSSTVDTKRHAF